MVVGQGLSFLVQAFLFIFLLLPSSATPPPPPRRQSGTPKPESPHRTRQGDGFFGSFMVLMFGFPTVDCHLREGLQQLRR